MPEIPDSQEGPKPTETETPIIKARWNEPFKLPITSLPESLPVAGGSNNTILPIVTYDLEISGYKDQTIIGQIIIAADRLLITDPFNEAVGQGTTDRNLSLRQPAGDVSVEYKIVMDSSGKPQIQATKTPLVVSVSTSLLHEMPSKGKIQDVSHFAKYGNAVLYGKHGRIDRPILTEYNGWGGDWDYQNNGIRTDDALMLLPYDPAVFGELQIIIGDKPPSSNT